MRVATGQCRSQGRTKPPTAQSGAKLKGLSAGQQVLDRSSHPLRRSVKHSPGQNGLVQSAPRNNAATTAPHDTMGATTINTHHRRHHRSQVLGVSSWEKNQTTGQARKSSTAIKNRATMYFCSISSGTSLLWTGLYESCNSGTPLVAQDRERAWLVTRRDRGERPILIV